MSLAAETSTRTEGETIRHFGYVGEKQVHELRLRSPGGLEAKVLTYGAVLRDLLIPNANRQSRSIVLGFDTLESYITRSPYFGSLVGRYSNRIGGGSFNLDGESFQLDKNEANRTTLHGGSKGISQRVWSIQSATSDQVVLFIRSHDGDQGFPGNLDIRCIYSLDDDFGFCVDVEAVTDAPTPVSLAQHSYFNLDGCPTIAGHDLTVHAARYIPVDCELIPTGEISSVLGTGFDLRKGSRLGDLTEALDLNYVLDASPPDSRADQLKPAAMLSSDMSGLSVEVWTTQPGLQVYDGKQLAQGLIGLHGRRYQPNSGICMETQSFPDSPNNSHFPDTILRPNEVYRHRTEYRIRVDESHRPVID